MNSELLSSLRKADHRTVSRLISQVENGDSSLEADLDNLYPHAQGAVRIGMTGAPGVGKSTLIDALIARLRSDGKSVGVISVDPTSPFSGGALLGDRIRMAHHTGDRGVFIRSMGSRGHAGGLARKTNLVADILACSGKDYILLETIGVGQAETDIVNHVDLTILVLVPESGDEIQFMKAGPVEAADVFVINKADRAGADRIAKMLGDTLGSSPEKGDIPPPVFKTSATQGEGVDSLFKGVMDLVETMRASSLFSRRRSAQYFARIRSAVEEELSRHFWNNATEDKVKKRVKAYLDAKVSPSDAARKILEEFKSTRLQ